MPTVYRITEEQVLASAGLDAFVVGDNFLMLLKGLHMLRLHIVLGFLQDGHQILGGRVLLLSYRHLSNPQAF